MKKFQHLILLGFPNSGKSFFGKKISKRFNCCFMDLDREFVNFFENKFGVSHKPFAREKSLQYFKIHDKWFKEKIKVLRKSKPSVINTGGALIYHKDIIDKLKKFCFMVFLSCDYETLEKRRDFNTKGIELRNSKTYKELFKQRLPFYKKYANTTILETECWKKDSKKIIKIIEENDLFLT